MQMEIGWFSRRRSSRTIGVAGEILLAVVNDVVGAEGAQHIELVGPVDDGHLGVILFLGDLKSECADTTALRRSTAPSGAVESDRHQ